MSDQVSSRPSNAASTTIPSPDGSTTVGGHRVLDLDGCYFVYVCNRDPGRERKLNARKDAGRRRKERMGTVTLSEFSGHRASMQG